jgi:hypothetical protein
MVTRTSKPPRDALDVLLWVPPGLLPRRGHLLGWLGRVALAGVALVSWGSLLLVLLGWD